MAAPDPTRRPHRRHPDYGSSRRATVLSLLSEVGHRPEWQTLTPGARTLYVVCALMCDDTGKFAMSDAEAAMADRSAVNYAAQLMKKAGV